MGIVFGRVSEETPKFELVAKKQDYEIRRYASYVLAELQGTAKTHEAFGSANFRALASYIGVFGNPKNQSQQPIAMTAPVLSSPQPGEKIAMTAPVLSSGVHSEMHSMAFILPSKFTIQTAPAPTDERIKLREVPPSLVAVHTYSGNTDEKEAGEKAAWLKEAVHEDGYDLHPDPHDLPHKQGWQLARYNPPFTIPFLKTNEIHVELADNADAN